MTKADVIENRISLVKKYLTILKKFRKFRKKQIQDDIFIRGSLERYLRVVPADEAPDAVIEEGSTRVFGWSRGGPIRALP